MTREAERVSVSELMRPSCAKPVEMARPAPYLGDEISGRDDVALEAAVCMALRCVTPTSFWPAG